MFGRQIILISLFVSCGFLLIKADNKTEWPSDGALVVLGGCLFGPGSGCDTPTSKTEVLAAPGSLLENCTVPPFPVPSFNHGTVFFNNTLITCGGMSLHTECLSWSPGATHWRVQHFLTTGMQHTYAVATSTRVWFMDFGLEVSNVLTHSDIDGHFSEGPNPSSKPRMFPCVISHPDSDTIIVISGYMYQENSTVEMYNSNMILQRYLPELYPARQSHSCGSIGNYVVVAGGTTLVDGSFYASDSVEVLNLDLLDQGWTAFPQLPNKMFDGVMVNLFGSLIIVGGTEDMIPDDQYGPELGRMNWLKRARPHNTSITNNVLNYPFQYSTEEETMTTRELGHTVVPMKINELCYKPHKK